jgi:hypothetical protein
VVRGMCKSGWVCMAWLCRHALVALPKVGEGSWLCGACVAVVDAVGCVHGMAVAS